MATRSNGSSTGKNLRPENKRPVQKVATIKAAAPAKRPPPKKAEAPKPYSTVELFKALARNSKDDKKKPNKVKSKPKKNGKSGKSIALRYDYTDPKRNSKYSTRGNTFQTSISAHQLVGQLTIPEANTTQELIGQTIFECELNPSLFKLVGERVARFGSVFDRFVIEEMWFEFEASLGTQNNGNIFGGYTFDPLEYFSNNEDGLRRLTAKVGSHDCPLYAAADHNKFIWKMPRPPNKNMKYYMDQQSTELGEVRWTSMGKFIIKAGYSIDTVGLPLTIGSLWLKTKVKFLDPTIQPYPGTESQFYYNGNAIDINMEGQYFADGTARFTGDPSNDAGVEMVDTTLAAGTGTYFYVPPGTWNVTHNFSETTITAAAAGHAYYHVTASIVTATNHVDMYTPLSATTDTENGIWRVQAPSMHYEFGVPDEIKYYHINGGTYQFTIPQDGIDYYYWATGVASGDVTAQWLYQQSKTDTMKTSIIFKLVRPPPEDSLQPLFTLTGTQAKLRKPMHDLRYHSLQQQVAELQVLFKSLDSGAHDTKCETKEIKAIPYERDVGVHHKSRESTTQIASVNIPKVNPPITIKVEHKDGNLKKSRIIDDDFSD